MRRGKASVMVGGWWMVAAPDHRWGSHAKGLRKKLCAARGGQELIENAFVLFLWRWAAFVGLCKILVCYNTLADYFLPLSKLDVLCFSIHGLSIEAETD